MTFDSRIIKESTRFKD